MLRIPPRTAVVDRTPSPSFGPAIHAVDQANGPYQNGAMIFTWPMPRLPSDAFAQLFGAVVSY